MIQWNTLDTTALLNHIRERSRTCDVLLFKHSTTCSVSIMAKLRLENQWDESFPVDFWLVDVREKRSISNDIAESFSVQHESPQVLLIRNEECIYDASHFDIQLQELKETLQWHDGK